MEIGPDLKKKKNEMLIQKNAKKIFLTERNTRICMCLKRSKNRKN